MATVLWQVPSENFHRITRTLGQSPVEAKLFDMKYDFLGHQKGDTTVPSSLIKEESLSKESELLGSSDIHYPKALYFLNSYPPPEIVILKSSHSWRVPVFPRMLTAYRISSVNSDNLCERRCTQACDSESVCVCCKFRDRNICAGGDA